MRICVFIEAIDKSGGGPSRSVPILARGIAKVGVRTTLMTFLSVDMNLHSLNDSGVETVILEPKCTVAELEKRILGGRFDLVHLQMIWLPVYHKVAEICKRNHIPYITTPRGTLEPWAYQGQGFLKNLKKKIAIIIYQMKTRQ